MATKSRSAAAKKAWATRRKLYGASGRGSGNKSNKSKKSTLTSMKKKDPRVGTKVLGGIKWGSKSHLDNLKYSFKKSPKSKFASSWRKKIKQIEALRK